MAEAKDAVIIELDVPDGLADAKQAVELVRAWVADGNLVVSLKGEAFGDQLQEWGRLLAHVGQHLAHAATLSGQISSADSLAAIRKGFDAALASGDALMAGKVRGRVTH